MSRYTIHKPWCHSSHDGSCVQEAEAAPPRATTPERWCVIFKRDAEPIDYCEGTPDEMLTRYERLSERWTGVVLCKVLVPDASACEMGESRARFDELRASSPTRESGALLDEMQLAFHGLPFGLMPDARCNAARAAVDRHLSTLERDAARMRERGRELRFAGGQLANCAFNLAQKGVLDARTRETLDACRKLWDSTTEKHVAALSPSGDTEPTP